MVRFFLFPLLLFSLNPDLLFSQTKKTDTTSQVKTMVAGAEFETSGFKRWLWGNNYRNVWTTPVTVKILSFDTSHFKNDINSTFLLRPPDKTLGKTLPQLFKGTFVEHRLKDAGSTSNPYAQLTIPVLAKEANVPYTNPVLVTLPARPSSGQPNRPGDTIYIYEETIKTGTSNLITTSQLLDNLTYTNSSSIDKKAFIRARLFDMLINDWNKSESHWLWSETLSGNTKIYKALPINRDQAFSTHDGLLLGPALNAAGFVYMQQFDNNIKNVRKFNYEERHLDRRLLNNTTLDEWQTIALDLQTSLNDSVIEKAIQQLPKEIYPVAGKNLVEKLKARRNHLFEWATEYYRFISKEIEITGSDQNEEFNIQQVNNEEILVQMFALKETGKKKDSAVYSRTFKPSETKEIRLFGLAGNDKYIFNGNTNNNIKIKVSDGIDQDSVIDISSSTNKKNIIVYSGKDNIKANEQNRFKIVNDTTFRSYMYNRFNYDRKGFLPRIFYSNEDRLFVGLGYNIKNYKWGKEPFASNQLIDLHYSLLENAFSITYRALIPKAVLGSDLTFLANYDDVRWQFYFGLGNDTKYDDNQKLKYYTTRTRQWIFQPGLTRSFGNSRVSIFADVQGIKVINDSARFIGKPSQNTTDFNWQTYAGGGINYSFQKLDDPLVPIKGFYLTAAAWGERNLRDRSSHYMSYSGAVYFYIPLVSKFSLNIRTGASTVTGNPEFYQYASIGGTIFRGVARDRFRGKTAFYNTNDVRFISPVRSYFFNGKAGFLAFVDNGRVWLPGENSNAWHFAYGGGVIVAPFNFLYADATYGRYKKESTIQVRLTLLAQR